MTNESKIIDGIQHKQCGKCKQFKPLDDFYKLKHGAFGVRGECKKCNYQRIYKWIKTTGYRQKKYQNDPEFRKRMKQRTREFRENNPEYLKEWGENHPDYQNIRYKEDPVYREMKKQRAREWAKAHPTHYRGRRCS